MDDLNINILNKKSSICKKKGNSLKSNMDVLIDIELNDSKTSYFLFVSRTQKSSLFNSYGNEIGKYFIINDGSMTIQKK